jgi:predicted DNA-binding transcriptional regulator YafY
MFFAATRMMQPLFIDGDNVDTIVRAISKRWQLECRYQNFRGDTTQETIEPYSLIFADEGLYCYARCEDSEKTDHIDRCILFNVSRFDSIRTLRRSFVYPERDEYDPQKLFEHCFGIFVPPRDKEPEEIELLFTPKWKAYLERHKWHASQSQPQIQDSGRLLVTFWLYITHDFVRWIRGLGNDVKVRAPEELRIWVEKGKDP